MEMYLILENTDLSNSAKQMFYRLLSWSSNRKTIPHLSKTC